MRSMADRALLARPVAIKPRNWAAPVVLLEFGPGQVHQRRPFGAPQSALSRDPLCSAIKTLDGPDELVMDLWLEFAGAPCRCVNLCLCATPSPTSGGIEGVSGGEGARLLCWHVESLEGWGKHLSR